MAAIDHSFLSALVLLLLVLDPLGSLPIFISVMQGVARERRRRVALREGVLAFAVLLAAQRIRRWLGASMVAAIEKLMGLVLTAVAVEMILAGLKRYFFDPG